MHQTRVLAPAKVNLTFDITGPLPGGYHQVETLMQAIDLQDELLISAQPSNNFQISIVCTNEIMPARFPLDDSNLMDKAARLLIEKVQPKETYSLRVEIEKNIPIGAGLAGGSADGAAMLVGLNELLGKPLSVQELMELGKQLGADVPFCITGGTSIGTGRGDVLQPIKPAVDLFYCIVKPRALSVSTPWAYQQYDAYQNAIDKPDLSRAVDALLDGDLQEAMDSFGNVFEPVIFAQHPELVPIKEQLLRSGAWCCHLSGSGPALFAIVADREQAHYIRRKILKTDDLEFDYVRLSTPDLGPPIEFYIAQSTVNGVTLLPPIPKVS